jgi:two-component system, OmpR family, sensor histidine kinase VicK
MERSLSQLTADHDALKSSYEELQLHCKRIEADLESRLKVEERLAESQKRFATIFHQSNVAHKIINERLEIIEMNKALSGLLGYTEEEILGTKILDYTHPDFIDYWHDLQVALWKEQVDKFQLEACLIKKDRSEIWVIVHTILYRDNHENFGYTLLEDITSRKQLERHKDDFISVVSHELKTPMTSIKAQSQMMARHLKKYEDGHADQMMAIIDKQNNRLTRLINNLVLVSKIERSKLHPDIKDYHLDKLVVEVVDEFRLSDPEREIKLYIDDSLLTKGDPDKIYQVIYNLLTNAFKFSNKESIVEVTVKSKDNWGLVCIEDHGQGIPKASIDHVFERFYKVKTTRSAVQAGIGLGLYISSEIISHQNGQLWVESEPGKGSTFCFKLPILQV